MTFYSGTVDALLRECGWYPRRSVNIEECVNSLESEGFFYHFPAKVFLAEFHGVALGVRGSGVNIAKCPVNFDPMLCSGESDRFNGWAGEIDSVLSPLGEYNEGEAFLAMDERSLVYVVDNELSRFSVNHLGVDFGGPREAIECLVRGIRPEEVPGVSGA